MSADIRRLVSQSSRVLGAAGLDDFIWGHSSARDPEGRGAWLKRSGIGLSEVAPDDVQLVSREGEVLEGQGDRHIEYPIHTEVYAARPDVGGVVHIHPPHAVALAASGVPLRPVSHQATLFTPPEPARFTATTDLIRSPGLGAAVAESLADRNAVFLVNHGIVAVGADLQTATVTALLLEEACRQQLLTSGYGGIATWTGDAEALEKRDRIYSPRALDKVWEYLLRRVESAS
jgi:L-fuculose-phosphate aldolase